MNQDNQISQSLDVVMDWIKEMRISEGYNEI